jgi:hypothetical protein
MDDKTELRLECLRLALEYGTQRDVLNPHLLADTYYEWVTQGSGQARPADNRKDGGRKQARKARSVREGSTPQLTVNATVEKEVG